MQNLRTQVLLTKFAGTVGRRRCIPNTGCKFVSHDSLSIYIILVLPKYMVYTVDLVILQSEAAISKHDSALSEQDNVTAALRFLETALNSTFQHGYNTKEEHNK